MRRHAGRRRERVEEPPLGRREVHERIPALHRPGGDIHHQILIDEHRAGGLGRRSTQERANPRQQLRRAERLRQVVVGAEVERRDLVLLRIADRQDQDRDPARPPDLATRREPVDVGEVQVQHDEVGLVVQDGAEGRPPIARRPHDVAARGERALHGPQDLGLVVHDEDDGTAHGAAGTSTTNVAPPPGVSVARISPSIAIANPLQIASPSPAPRRADPSCSR